MSSRIAIQEILQLNPFQLSVALIFAPIFSWFCANFAPILSQKWVFALIPALRRRGHSLTACNAVRGQFTTMLSLVHIHVRCHLVLVLLGGIWGGGVAQKQKNPGQYPNVLNRKLKKKIWPPIDPPCHIKTQWQRTWMCTRLSVVVNWRCRRWASAPCAARLVFL